jgi:type I restriction-modification system DNA methylase subunit
MFKRHKNRNLFSNHYLENLLPKDNAWNVNVEPAFEELRNLWDKSRDTLPSLNESQLRTHFLDKVFELLGFTIDVEPPVAAEEWAVAPDYALFTDKDALKAARKGSYFDTALCLGEAKRWGRPLDKKLAHEKGLEIQNPSLQMSRYLWFSGVKWGILTDGRLFRLYEREKSKKLDIYYEIDLEDIISYGTLDDFKYFYLFFRADAFSFFLNKVLKESIDYAIAVGNELKKNAYRAVYVLGEGFLKSNGLSRDDIQDIYDNTLILLYRLLFTLYAEYRGLLPVDENDLYRDSYSLYSIKRDIAQRFDSGKAIPTTTFNYWNDLKGLFETINLGNKELGVPPYNGGLFSPGKYPFLEKYRLGGYYIAKAIDLLSRSSDGAFIDYGTLEIRHLGSIYEGLLEYHLKMAEEDLYPIKEKKGEKYVPLKEAKKSVKKEDGSQIVYQGELYLATDKGERKATGSYYTPDYIVEYIVENTLGPVVEEKKTKTAKSITELKGQIKAARGKSRELLERAYAKAETRLIEELLTIKILDPAMGSGHFLVEATDFLAAALIKALGESPGTIQEDETRWARREVVEKCIFGVDSNPLAVELAKLSLWLHTVAKNRPLSFLDHHLRCGNSLIGATLSDMANLPDLKKKKIEQSGNLLEPLFKEKVSLLLKDFALIEGMPSDSVDQIRQKEKLYGDFRNRVSRFQVVADVWTSIYFGNDKIDYDLLLNNLRAEDNEWNKAIGAGWVKKARLIAEEKRFFHWELEFPEIFFEGHLRKENPGFDCVVGNPPYVNAIELNKVLSQYEKPYWKTRFKSASGAYDMYILFYELSLSLTKENCAASLITPNKFLSAPYATAFRRYIYENHQLINLLNCSRVKVFDEPSIYPIIATFRKGKSEEQNIIISTLFSDGRKSSVEHPNQYLGKLPDYIWGFLLSENVDIILKIEKVCKHLSELACVQATSSTAEADSYEDALVECEMGGQRFINTGLIDRYSTKWGLDALSHKGVFYREPCLDISNPIVSHMRKEMYQNPKILFAKMAMRIEGFIDSEGKYASANTNCVFKPSYDVLCLGALLNSKLMSFIYDVYFGALIMSGGYHQYQAPQLRILPIPIIEFIASTEMKKKFLNQAIVYYEAVDRTNILRIVEDNLTAGRKDAIHRLLVFLSGRMMEMCEKKNEEIKGFLKWLERETGTNIERLRNKTLIREYYSHNFEQFLGTIKENKGLMSIDPSRRKIQEILEKHYKDSISLLEPLKERIKMTDDLIDRIVYKLYNLTEKEIEIVESSFRS